MLEFSHYKTYIFEKEICELEFLDTSGNDAYYNLRENVIIFY